MKTLFCLIVLTLALSTTSTFARIGESRQEVSKRYGDGKRSDIQRIEGAKTMKYHFNGFEVEVVFLDNKSIWEIFHGNLVTSDVKMILKANAGGQAWHYDGMNLRWERSGDPKYMGYFWPGHEDYFCIVDVKAIEAIMNSDAGDLKGF